MSLRSWWEERKRLQEEREARRYAEDWDEDDLWTSPEDATHEPPVPRDEPEPVADAEPEMEPEPEEPEPEPDPEPDPATELEADAAVEPDLTPGDVSWWKRRLFAAADQKAAPEPEPQPVAVDAEAEPEPEPEPQPQPEPEPEPAAEAEEESLEPALVEDDVEADDFDAALDLDDDLLDDEPPEPVVDQSAALPPVSVDFPGPRRARLDVERRSKRREELRNGVIAAAVAAVVGLGGVVSILSRDEAPQPPAGVAAKGAEAKDTITTTLVFGTKEKRADAGPTWLTLVSWDSAAERGAVVYIPPHTATGVPGRGLLPVGEALASGGVPLLLLAAETLLGTPVDRYLELSDADAAVLFEETGPLTVDVPADVRVSAGPGQARLVFGAGPQRLSPQLLVSLLYVKGMDGDDVELGTRHLAFWTSLFEAFSFDADGLGEAFRRSGAALGESDASLGELGRLFERLAGAESDDRAVSLLPVRQVGVGGSELYQVDEREVEEFLEDTVGSQAVAGKEVRVQILNGNGAPGIGQFVAERLGGEGFRVILSGNARRLNYRETLVITYDRSSKGLGLAERTRDLIGVGEVQVAAQSQGIVDLTIVVGKDFLKTL